MHGVVDITLAGSSAPDMIAAGMLCGYREIRRGEERKGVSSWYRIVSILVICRGVASLFLFGGERHFGNGLMMLMTRRSRSTGLVWSGEVAEAC